MRCCVAGAPWDHSREEAQLYKHVCVCVCVGGHWDLLKIELLATLVAESEFGHLPRKQTLRLGLSEGEASFPAPQPNHG